jgi:ferredoxin
LQHLAEEEVMTPLSRKIVEIDEEKCDGCGDCVPTCAEGAIQIIDGKARLIADNLCDGIGNCLGICPHGAITVIERLADAYNEAAVRAHLKKTPTPRPRLPLLAEPSMAHDGGCPGSRLRQLARQPAPAAGTGDARPSMLGQWPVQLALLPPAAPIWQDAEVLIAADCVPLAMADFHERLLAGKTVAIACPKLDHVEPYVDKLTAILTHNDIRSLAVAFMEVPCCIGIVHLVTTAIERSGKPMAVQAITINVDGTVGGERELVPQSRATG